MATATGEKAVEAIKVTYTQSAGNGMETAYSPGGTRYAVVQFPYLEEGTKVYINDGSNDYLVHEIGTTSGSGALLDDVYVPDGWSITLNQPATNNVSLITGLEFNTP